jgi:N-acyl-L-homoserine lactone synthetase
MRFLPTTGPTMVNDHFPDLAGGVRIESPLIWECSRFCLAEDAGAEVSAALMLGGLELGLRFHLAPTVGVFDARMIRIYRRLGWSPTLLGTAGEGREAVSVGLWDFEAALRPGLLERAGIPEAAARRWADRDLAAPAPEEIELQPLRAPA